MCEPSVFNNLVVLVLSLIFTLSCEHQRILGNNWYWKYLMIMMLTWFEWSNLTENLWCGLMFMMVPCLHRPSSQRTFTRQPKHLGLINIYEQRGRVNNQYKNHGVMEYLYGFCVNLLWLLMSILHQLYNL